MIKIFILLLITPTIALATINDVPYNHKKSNSFTALFTQYDPYKSGGLKDSEGCSGLAFEDKEKSRIKPKQSKSQLKK